MAALQHDGHPHSTRDFVSFFRILFCLRWAIPQVLGHVEQQQHHETLSFASGGVPLEPKQPMIPPGLYSYHTNSLEWTEEAYTDRTVSVVRGIPYGVEKHQQLDVWMPADAGSHNANNNKKEELIPIIFLIHGGGWEIGYREYCGFMARHLCGTGILATNGAVADDGFGEKKRHYRAIVVSPTYQLGRFNSQAWPQSRNDILAAIKFMIVNAKTYRGDANFVLLSGHSAGGHLAAAVGLDPDLQQSNGINPTSIRGLFLISCPLGVRPRDFFVPSSNKKPWRLLLFHGIERLRHYRQVYRKHTLSMLGPIVGGRNNNNSSTTIKQQLDLAREASPLAKLEELTKKKARQDLLPFVHYAHAHKGDFQICQFHARRLERLLPNDKTRILAMPVDGHLETCFCLNDPTCEWYGALADFLEREKQTNNRAMQ